MDRIDEYRQLVKKIIEAHAIYRPANGDIEAYVIFDEKRDHYELMFYGWQDIKRVHGSVIHVHIRNGKIWILHDGTEGGVALELVEAGVPREHIVLGFQPEYKRKYTEFAVG